MNIGEYLAKFRPNIMVHNPMRCADAPATMVRMGLMAAAVRTLPGSRSCQHLYRRGIVLAIVGMLWMNRYNS
jgi:hypothetical protein